VLGEIQLIDDFLKKATDTSTVDEAFLSLENICVGLMSVFRRALACVGWKRYLTFAH
jgi:hypothetical protein